MTRDEMAAKLRDVGERTLSNIGFTVTGKSAVAFGALLVNAADALADGAILEAALSKPPVKELSKGKS